MGQVTAHFKWTPGREQLLMEMWNKGESGGAIAAALGWQVTRNAVIGKAHRMVRAAAKAAAIGADDDTSGLAVRALSAAHAVSAADGRRHPTIVHTRNRNILPAEPVVLAPNGPAGGVDFETMSADRLCAYAINTPPLGRADDLRFCGAQRLEAGHWCASHRDVVFDPSRKVAAAKRARTAAKARREEVA
tara:strand:- start:8196 stop:8765 length:570 start_codon:yes stop_codon:yes gene_type:complete